MSFLHPEFLYWMLPPLFILFVLLLTQKEAQGHFFSDEVMDKLRVSANTLTLKARNALFFLIGILLIVAMAGPIIKEGKVEVKAKSADIMLALDISDSMLAGDVYPNRLKLAKKKAVELLNLAPDERIGVVAFAKNSYLVSPMSFDHDAVGFLLRQLNTESITEKGTDFLSLLEVVDKTIKKDSKKYLLILSDGGDSKDFSKEIEFAKEKNIVVYILGIGTKKGVPIKLKDGTFIKHNDEIIVAKLNENISKLATSSGGIYVESVKSDDDIKAMLKEIENSSEQRELKSEEIQKFIPLFYYPLGVALILLLIATSSMSKREKVHLPSVFILFSFLFLTPDYEAGLLDFMELKEAKEAYETGKYERSSEIYSKYANSSHKGDSYYNQGNSLYKQGKYSEAIETYKKATFDDDISRANNLANIGNSYAKKGKREDLQEAVRSYEESLKLNDDKDVSENLEAVKKALEKQKQQQNKDDKQNKDEQNKEKRSDDSQNSGENKENLNDKKKSDKKNDSSESKTSDENKDENSEDAKNKEEQDNSSNKRNNEKKSQDNKEENQNNETKQDKKDNLKQLNKDDSKTKESASQTQNDIDQDKMSDVEEQKWLNQINNQQSSYMYMLNDNKTKQRDENEKPW